MNTLPLVDVSLLAIQATRCARYAAIASQLAPTGFGVEGLHHG